MAAPCCPAAHPGYDGIVSKGQGRARSPARPPARWARADLDEARAGGPAEEPPSGKGGQEISIFAALIEDQYAEAFQEPPARRRRPLDPGQAKGTKAIRRAGSSKIQKVRFDMCNITEWGPTLRKEFPSASEGADFVLMAEHRLDGDDVRKAELDWQAAGFRTHTQQALRTGSAKRATSAGVAILHRHHLRVEPIQGPAGVVGTHRWCAVQWHLRGCMVLVAVMYLVDGEGLSENNMRIVMELIQLYHEKGLPLLLMGDFNVEPQVMMDAGIWQPLGIGLVKFASADCGTCSSGEGRTLDYCLASECLMAILSTARIDWKVPWKPHARVSVDVLATPGVVTIPVLQVPRPIPPPEPARVEISWDDAVEEATQLLPSWFGNRSWPRLVQEHADGHPEAELIAASTTKVQVWALATEIQQISATHLAADPESRRIYCGRGQPPRISRKPFRVVPPRHLTSSALPWWNQLQSQLTLLASDRATGATVRAASIVKQLAFCSPPLPVRKETQQVEEAWHEWRVMLAQVEDMGALDLKDLTWRAAKEAEFLQRRLRRTREVQWQEWVAQAIQKGGGIAHAFTKDDRSPMHYEGSSMQRAIESRQLIWQDIWQRDLAERVSVQARLQRIREELKGADVVPSPEAVTAYSDSLLRVPLGKKCGMDGVSPHMLKRASPQSRANLAGVLLPLSRIGLITCQIMCILTALLDKPTGPGDRPITLLSFLYRTLVKDSAQSLRSWEQEYSGDWDSARAGRGVLDAVWCSEAHFEVSRFLHKEAAALLLDLTKFYDYVSWAELISDACKLNFPLDQLLMSIETYMSPRFVKKYSALSSCFAVGNAVLAGCGRAVALVRTYLWQVMHQLRTTFPRISLRQFVDDLMVAAVGTRSAVQSNMKQAMRILLRELSRKRCIISSKTVVLGSKARIRANIVAYARTLGHSFAQSISARDLGIDSALSRRRTVRVSAGRQKRARARGSRNVLLCRARAGARKLMRGGALAQGLWGHQIHGVAPSRLRRLRAMMAKAACPGKSGGMSSTTLIHLSYHPRADPAVFVPRNIVMSYLTHVQRGSLDMDDVSAVWGTIHARLSSGNRWAKATGPLAATMCTIMDLGWDPRRPCVWEGAEGERYIVDNTASLADSAQLLEDTIITQLWVKASVNHLGFGLGQQPAFQEVYRYFTKLRLRDPRQAQVALRLLAGGWWTEARLHLCNMQGHNEGRCRHCGARGDAAHHLWMCPMLQTGPLSIDPRVIVTTHLATKARDARCYPAAKWSRCWLLAPEVTLPLPTMSPCAWHVGSLDVDPSIHVVCVDGSGGRFSSKPALRRCGWGVAIMDKITSRFVGGLFGPMHGRQSVPRAELWATHQAAAGLPKRGGSVTVFSDHLSVVDFANNPRKDKSQSVNHALYRQLDLDGIRLPGSFEVRKVMSHISKARRGRLPVLGSLPDAAYVGNEVADALAGEGAAKHELDRQAVAAYDNAVNDWIAMLHRGIAVFVDWCTRQPKVQEYHVEHSRTTRYTLGQRLARSQHRIRLVGKRMVCTLCLRFSGIPMHSKYEFLESSCGGATVAGASAHASHKLRWVSRLCNIVCLRCGCTVHKPKGLVRPCGRRAATDPLKGVRDQSLAPSEEVEWDEGPSLWPVAATGAPRSLGPGELGMSGVASGTPALTQAEAFVPGAARVEGRGNDLDNSQADPFAELGAELSE